MGGLVTYQVGVDFMGHLLLGLVAGGEAGEALGLAVARRGHGALLEGAQGYVSGVLAMMVVEAIPGQGIPRPVLHVVR